MHMRVDIHIHIFGIILFHFVIICSFLGNFPHFEQNHSLQDATQRRRDRIFCNFPLQCNSLETSHF